jgi:predicted RNase H-like HicB family nuclease
LLVLQLASALLADVLPWTTRMKKNAKRGRPARVPKHARRNKSSQLREFDVVIERDADGWLVATVPALPGCHTQARSLDQLMERAREAIALCLEVEGAPHAALEFVGVQRVRVA